MAYTKEKLLKLFEFYGNKCLACGSTEKLTADHVVPLVVGGYDDLTNIQPLCKPCNSRKGNKTVDYRPSPYPYTPRRSSIVFMLRKVSESKGVSLMALHYGTQISLASLRKYWAGHPAQIDRNALDRLCKFLGCTPGDMIQLADAKLDPLTLATTVKDVNKKE